MVREWVHGIKLDGYRIQGRIDSGKVCLLTRKALDWANRFPTIAVALELLDVHKALLDGEIVLEARFEPHAAMVGASGAVWMARQPRQTARLRADPGRPAHPGARQEL